MRVGLVIVSHSDQLARGVAEVAAQMAPDVHVAAAGGSGGTVGTDYDRTVAALSEADSGSGVVVLYDLGSAQMTAELAVESLDDPQRAVLVDAPLVEGAVAAAVAAQGAGERDAVADAARGAGGPAEGAEQPTEQAADSAERAAGSGEVGEEIRLDNEVGLHARPAALLARSLTGLDAEVTVSFGGSEVDAHSVLAIMGLGARKGDRIGVRARGADAERAVRTVVELADRNFDE